MSDPARMMGGMLLVESGSKVEGDTEDVLRVIFQATWDTLRELMPEDDADGLALRHVVRVHAYLAQHGMVTRVLE